MLKIKDKKTLDIFLDVIAESSASKAYDDILRGKAEKEEKVQNELSHSKDSNSGSDVIEDDDESGKEDVGSEKSGGENDQDSKKILFKAENITFDMIKDKLNTIRSGKSLKDSDTKTKLSNYWNKIDDPEKVALFVYLDSISKILTAGLDADQVQDPSDPPPEIKMTQDSSSEKEEVPEKRAMPKRKERIPAPSPAKKEDTTPPIAVGRKQEVESIRRKIWELLEN